jgi:uncharacterized protein
MLSFVQLLERIHDIWLTRQADIEKQSTALRRAFGEMTDKPADPPGLNAIPLDIARKQIEQQFDAREGGFSGAPKFPHPSIIQQAIRHWAASTTGLQPDPRILHCALYTLNKMAAGGIFDHLGGGFCRYSTDEQWMIPHFEKMLYDNGPLLWLNAQAFCISGEVQLYDAAIETGEWVMREMQAPEGGYYSALDADSEGEEGRFYVWQKDEISSHLHEPTYSLFAKRFGLEREPNFESQWHLHAYACYEKLAEATDRSTDDVRLSLLEARKRLFLIREQRVHPGLDDKILTSWNGLMIQGMAEAGRLLGREDFIDSAVHAVDFIHSTLWSDGRLFATTKNGTTHINAYLDDYAFLLNGLLSLLQARWNSRHFDWALKIADAILALFEDSEGGFYFTSHDHEQLIQRGKYYSDDAMPSGNGVAASALIHFGYLSGETRFLKAAENCLKSAWQQLSQHPISHSSLLSALQDYLKPPDLVILRGEPDELAAWNLIAARHYLSNTYVYAIANGAKLSPALASKQAVGSASAYICTGVVCQNPITDITSYQRYVDERAVSI